MKRVIHFKTEAELCAAFIADAAARWNLTAYAETSGWDILMVAPDGTQIGVQAKMQFNMKLLYQTIEDGWSRWNPTGPDFRAVLLPYRDGDPILQALGIGAFWPDAYPLKGRIRFNPELEYPQWSAWHYWNPEQRVALPKYVPDVVAGASGPIQLTKWKIAALQIMATLELRGYVTRDDFKQFGIDHRRWTNSNEWLIPGTEKGRYVRGPNLNFDKQHPDVYGKVRADIKAAMNKGLELV